MHQLWLLILFVIGEKSSIIQEPTQKEIGIKK